MQLDSTPAPVIETGKTAYRVRNFKRYLTEKISSAGMILITSFFILLPLLILAGLLIKSYPIIANNDIIDMLLSPVWLPMQSKFGYYIFIYSSVMVTAVSIIISAPVCLLSAIYLTQYSKKVLKQIMHPVIDILAGIPSVVYGLWGVLVIVPFVSDSIAVTFGIEASGYSILAGAIVLAVMTIPYVLNLLIEVLEAIPVELKEASLSMGFTYWETIKKVILRKAGSGILASFGLGISKAFGETIAVLMVIGNVVQIPENIFSPAYPLPSLIANNYGEMMSIPMFDSALMLAALILFVILLIFNIVSRLIINISVSE